MNYLDYSYIKPPVKSRDLTDGYAAMMRLSNFDRSWELWKKFFDKFKVEIHKIEAILTENISNFIFLADCYHNHEGERSEILGYLRQFSRNPGFYVGEEAKKIVFVCKHKEALSVFNDPVWVN